MSTALNIGTLPQGFCPATYQTMLNGFGAALSVDIPTTSGFTISATKPSSTSNVWFRIDSLGRYLGTYIFGQGSWLSAHPMQPGFTVWWFAALPTFTTYDGGDSSSVGPASGPMWQQAKDGNGTVIAAEFVISAGTLPSATVLSIGGSGGEETHVLTAAEIASHQHKVGIASLNTDSWMIYGTTTTGIPGSATQLVQSASGPVGKQPLTAIDGGSDGSHNNMPPYVVGYLLQRTARIFYSVP
jgi:microcystin-dependent protein